MSDPNAILVVSKEMRNKMAKPRMTKSEKAMFRAINEIVFATPEIRDGKKYLDRAAFHKLPDQTQKIWMYLSVNKTY